MPSVKELVRKVGRQKIKNLCCTSDQVQVYKQKLLDWLRYKNYRHGQTITDDPNNFTIKSRQSIDEFPYRIFKKSVMVNTDSDESDSDDSSEAYHQLIMND